MINTETIKNAVYNLCLCANISLCNFAYSKIARALQNAKNPKQKNILKNILLNAKIAHDTKRPLCQDTGQVLVFLEIGQSVQIEGGDLKTAINEAVEKCYSENFLRKSVVKNALFERENTKTNTPAIIYIDIVKGDEIKINVLIKGAGSENKSSVFMALPTLSKDEIKDLIVEKILSSGLNACPPMFIGLGVGQTLEGAALLSKKALFTKEQTEEEKQFCKEILKELNEKAPENYEGIYALDVKMLSEATHIASMPVGVTLNCHSMREAECIIRSNSVIYNNYEPNFIELDSVDNEIKEILANDIQQIKGLNEGENVLLTGEIYVARDAAHKKLSELIRANKPMPFDLKDKIILYAGPCPAAPDEIIGPIGPTTAGRMDKYAVELYENGLLGTIGKGSRSEELKDYIRKNNRIYFSMQGGVASLMKTCVQKSEIIAFEELGAEAVYKLYVEKLPLTVEII